jgi:hypothetical protein
MWFFKWFRKEHRHYHHKHEDPVSLEILRVLEDLRYLYTAILVELRKTHAGKLQFRYQGEIIMALAMNTIQSVNVAVEELDAKGRKVVPAGAISWASSDETVLTVTPSADTFSADVVAVGAVGKATITATDGVLVGSLEVDVTAAPAVVLNLIPGIPTP